MNWAKIRTLGIWTLGVALVAVFISASESVILPWVALGLFVVVAAVDIALAFYKQKTISQAIHGAFNQRLDYAILVACLVLTWFVWDLAGFLPVLMGVVLGHLFWRED